VWWWKVVLGSGIVLFGLRELFRDVFHPGRSGTLSEWVGYSFFRKTL
jgi:hypothetical protein